MIFKDYYKILGLKTNKVTQDQLKNVYRLAVKKLAEEKIKDINEAYRVLSNPGSKRKYDRIWTKNNTVVKQKQNKQEIKKDRATNALGEFVNMFFGNVESIKEKTVNKIEKNPVRGENIETNLEVDIEEVFYGLDKKISVKLPEGGIKTFNVSIPAGINNGEKIRLIRTR